MVYVGETWDLIHHMVKMVWRHNITNNNNNKKDLTCYLFVYIMLVNLVLTPQSLHIQTQTKC